MRVASFVPTGTEWMYALGLDDRLVSVTFECDVPSRAKREKPLGVRSFLEGAARDARGIDALVRERVAAGGLLYEVDGEVLRAARPDLLLTQSLCDVCAASHAQVAEARRALGYAPRLLELAPARLDEIPEHARLVARAVGAPGAGDALAREIAGRIEAVRAAVRGRSRPRVVVLEWTDPPMAAGHWIPDMVEAAGAYDPLGAPGAKSRVVSWDEVHGARPHAVLVTPCGFDLERSVGEARRVARELPRASVLAFDASRYFARSGPSVATGVEVLAHALHPEVWPRDGDPAAWRRVQ